MTAKSVQFRVLLRVFFARFFENELAGGGQDLKTSFFALMAFLAAPGLIVPIILGQGNQFDPTLRGPLPASQMGWAMLARFHGLDALRAVSLDAKTLYLGCALAAAAMLTALVWNSLLPNRRDVLVLGPLPLRASVIVRARLVALAGYVGLVAVAMHALASISFGFFLAAGNTFGFGVRGIAAHFVASCAASAFVFFAVVSAQGLLLVLAGPRLFARLSSVLQIALVALIVASLLALPTIGHSAAATLGHGDGDVRPWILLTPALWFLGLYESLLGTADPALLRLAWLAITSLSVAIGVTIVTYSFAYHRLAISAIEHGELGRTRVRSFVPRAIAGCLSRDPYVQAVSEFFLATITRVDRQRLVISVAIGITGAWATAGWLAAGPLSPRVPPLELLTIPFSSLVFLLVGVRLAAAIPADAARGWLFDVMAPTPQQARQGVERLMLALVVFPILAVSTTMVWSQWGSAFAMAHAAFFGSVAMLALEVVLWRFSSVPCTQPWRPERANLKRWWPAYLGGFAVFTTLAASLDAGLWILFVAPGPLMGATFRTVATTLIVGAALGAARLVRRASADEAPWDEGDTNLEVLTDALRSAAEMNERVKQLPQPTARPRLSRPPAVFASFNKVRRDEAEDRWFDGISFTPRHLGRDLVLALRRLSRSPAFTIFSVVTLALGVGATTTVYSLARAVTNRPMEIREASQVVSIRTSTGGDASLSWLDFQDLRAAQQAFASIEASSDIPVSLAGRDKTLVVDAMVVTGGYFETLGITATLGRALQIADDNRDAPPAALLSESTWRTRFGADPAIVGQPIRLGGADYTVAGVLPSSFRGINVAQRQPAVWVPIAHTPLTDAAAAAHRDPSRRDQPFLKAVARLRPGQAIGAARGQVESIAHGLDESAPLPARQGAAGSARRWTASPIADNSRAQVPFSLRFALLLLPGLVLLIACTNLSNLVLSRGAARTRDVAVRRALGASRWDLVREQLVEHTIVAIAGGAGGVVIARTGVIYVAGFIQQSMGYAPQYQLDARLDLAVLGAAFAAVALAVIVAGLMPAIQLTRGGTTRVFASDAISSASPRWKGRGKLIAFQVAASVALLLVAALGVRAVLAEQSDPNRGMDLGPVGAMQIALGLRTHDAADADRLTRDLTNEARRNPGIATAAVISELPGIGAGGSTPVRTTTPDRAFDLGPDGDRASLIAATPEIFRVIGLPLLSGRPFDGTETAASGPVAIISESQARSVAGPGNALGREMMMRFTVGTSEVQTRSVTIVGIVANAGVNSDGRPRRDVYVPFAQRPTADLHYLDTGVTLLARSNSATAAPAVAALWKTVRRVDPDLAVSFAGQAGLLEGTSGTAIISLLARIASTLALIALALSMAGLYGVVSHVVAGRTKELGIRIALGASRAQILRLVFTDGARPVIQGLAGGLVGAALTRMALQPYFHGPVSALDSVALLIGVTPLILAAAIACYLPARRASRVEPNVALRDQ